jgi:hypothetical protein
MALIMDFAKTIAQPIGELAVWLEETYNVDRTQVSQKWSELTGMKLVIQDEEEDAVGTVSAAGRRSASVSSTASSKAACKHVFMVGEKKGQQCTTKPKNGAEYCSAHKPKKPKDSESNVADEVEKPKKKSKKDETTEDEAEKPKKKSSTKSKEEDSKTAKKPKKAAKKEEELVPLSEEESEEEIPKSVEPLLKKKPFSKKAKKTVYDTDEEIIDAELNLEE